MQNIHYSQEIHVFHGRVCPEIAILVGYGAIIDKMKLAMPFPQNLAVISKKNRQYKTENWQIFTPRHNPKDTLYDHLVFALKYEGIDLLFLKKMFEKLNQDEIVALVSLESTGQYSRKIWFLYEWLMAHKLPIEDLQSGNYVPLLNKNIQYGIANGANSRRQRIVNNLPGTVDFCPLIFKTEKIENYLSIDLKLQSDQLLNAFRLDILQRTSAFLLLKDSKASFTIEGETPTSTRASRWGQAIGQAGKNELNKAELERLQQIVIENSKFIKYGFRQQQGFIGEHDRDTFSPIPSHISAKWQDIDTLINGLLDTAILLKKSGIHPILIATGIAFGFVFIHPFVDGNGRLHRYLIHHILSETGFSSQGIIFPVSAAILNKIDDYRVVLENYSTPILEYIHWHSTQNNNVEIDNETIDFYRYFDATKQAEFLFDCVYDTIHKIIPSEINYLLQYDEYKRIMDDKFQMADKQLALLVNFLRQNNGILSKRAIDGEFKYFSPDDIIFVEKTFEEIFAIQT
jgi:Fic family protein